MSGNRRKSPLLILVTFVLFGILCFLPSASAQEVDIQININEDLQKADFTVDGVIILPITGNFTIDSTLPATVYFGIYAPDGWETSITPTEYTVTFGTTVVEFEGEVSPTNDASQEEHNIYVWASNEGQNPTPQEIMSTSPTVFSSTSIIDVIQNRIKLSSEVVSQKLLPASTVSYSVEVTNSATVADTFIIELLNDEGLESQGWEISLSHDNLDLGPGETRTISIEQQIPSDAPNGDYEVVVFVTSEGHAHSIESQSLVTEVRMPKINSPIQLDWMLLFMVGFVVTGISIAAIFAATEYGYLAFISLFLPLYVRLKKKDVLSHFTRGQIFGYIQANPGAHYNAIIQDLRLQNGVGAYHLKVLEREGFVRSLKDGIYKRFYPSNMRIPEKRLHLSRIQRDIFSVIHKHPGVTQKQISKLLDESKQVVHYHVKILEGASLIRLERAGRETACYAGKVKYVAEDDVYQLADEKGATQIMNI